MAEVITRFRLETTQYDSKLRDAAKGLADYTKQATMAGNEFGKFTQKNVEAARALGNISPSATNAKDKVKELVTAYNDLYRTYDKLTQEQQQTDFGKAMAQSMVQLREKIREAKQELYSMGDAAQEVKSKFGGGLFGEGGFTGMLQVAGGSMLAAGIQKLGSEIGDTIQQSVELAKSGEGIRMAFERLNRPDLLDNLKEATHGTVSELELMKAAVQFNDFKLPVEQLGTMLEFAQKKAKDTGQSVDYMVQSIVTGLGRKSLMILDNLGLSAAQVKEKMAETGDMTTAVAAIIKEQMSEAGEYVETAADRAARAAADAQNQMEKLGRQAMPVAEQWSQTWLTIKTGALDLLNSAVTPLINALTTAGRLRAAQQDRGSQGRVAQQIAWLQNPGSEGKQSVYERINDSYVDEINHARTEYNKLRKDAIWNPFAAWNADKALANLNAIKQEFADFKSQAAPIMKPSGNKIEVKTDEAVQDVDTLKKKTGSTGTNPVKQAADKVAAAQHEYAQSIEMAKMQLDNGTKTEADYKKQLLSAEERLWNALGDAYNIHKDPKYKEAQDECADNIKKLGGEVNASIEAQKKAQEAARELEQAQKKLATAQRELADAKQKGNLKDIYTAQKKVDTAQADVDRLKPVEVPVLPKLIQSAWNAIPDQAKKLIANEGAQEVPIHVTYTNENLDAFVGNLKQKLSQAEVGSTLYNNLTAQLADANALGNLMQTAIKNGIDVAQFDPQELWRKVFGDNPGDYISDETWQGIVDKINEQMSNAGQQITLDTKTGDVKDKKPEKTEKTDEKLSKLASGLSSITSGMQNLGIEIPDGVQKFIGAIQGIASIIQGVETVISVFQVSSLTANTAAIMANTAALTANSFMQLWPFANGGVAHAAEGWSGNIPGNNFSGDMVPIMVNSGELILNRAQQGNLASQLVGGGGQQPSGSPYVTGEMIYLGLTNYLKSTGRGEIMTSRFKQ